MQDFSLEIRQGEYIAIVGANGSGKTTFSRLLSGILQPDKGHVTINGAALIDASGEINYDVRSKVSVVLQNPEDQFVGSSVREDIAFGLENHAVPREEMDAIITASAQATNITEFLDKEPSQLSGGQKQRVAIASTLALQTEYMVFDEATSQLDPEGKREVMAAIEDVVKRKDKTIILVTHDLEEVLRADRVLVFSKGQIVADVSPVELFTGDYPLEEYNLVLPLLLQYSQHFKAQGIITETYLKREELVEALCK